MKILHVLEASLPHIAGYTIRSKYILENQKKMGWTPIVMTSPYQASPNQSSPPGYEFIEGIKHYRTHYLNTIGGITRVRLSKLQFAERQVKRYQIYRRFRQAIIDVCREEKPLLIHAYSSYLCGYPAYLASRVTNIPMIYEVRSLWEYSAIAKQKTPENSNKIKFIKFMEARTVKKADKVITLGEGLKTELVRRGADIAKIDIVPNGVDVSAFSPLPPDQVLIEKYRLMDQTVVGYIGSMTKYEGLDLLIEAMRQIKIECPNVKVLLVGDGAEKTRLEKKVEELGLSSDVMFAGQVAHDMVLKYYSIIDVFVYPRIDTLVTQLVTPLKSLEAMCLGKPIIASNVGGLKEITQDNKTGVLFNAGDTQDLVRKCISLMREDDKRRTLGEQAREWVINHRDWPKIIASHQQIYESLLS